MSFLGPSRFHIVINDLGDRTRNTLIKFGGDRKLRSTGRTPEGRIKIQNYSEKFHLYPKREEKRCYPVGSCARYSLSQEQAAVKHRMSSIYVEIQGILCIME